MHVVEVTTDRLREEFLDFPKRLYGKDPNWVCPLDAEIEAIFDPQSNKCFQHGKAIRWILTNDDTHTIGRIAAFVDYNKSKLYEHPTGGAGFFECIDHQEAANLLFDEAKKWLLSKGMEAMLAPINFGENYVHWGLLIDGFVRQGYGMQYNYPYYRNLFENYGFRNYFEQLSFHKLLSEEFPGRMLKFAEFVEKRPGLSFEHFSYRNKQKYIHDFVFTYNAVWSKFHEGYTPLLYDEIQTLLEEAKLVIEEKFIWFAYDNGKPAGLMVAFPDINQVLRKLKNGKLTLFNKIRLFIYRKSTVTRARVFIFGILPEYQNTGLVAALFYQLVKVLKRKPRYKEIELSWVGDYNPKMINIYFKIGGKQTKKHATYLYHFEPGVIFKRFDNEFEGKLYK